MVDWVGKSAYKDPKGIGWTLTTRLADLEFAGDICALSHRFQDAQHQTKSLETVAKQTGLSINAQKTKSMRLNTNQQDCLKIDDSTVVDVQQFTYLGSIVSTSGGTDEDISTRKKKTQQELWRRTKQQPTTQTKRARKWKWIGHTIRKKTTHYQASPRMEPQGHRKRGRPQNTWRRGLTTELSKIGMTLKETKRTAMNRKKWRETVVALYPP
ncbi:Hypothetical predicted protein [Mytilus galloprovincialis]|uniref:Reverse transcriptase domain-containing protein n=1 Tax=Mytilus galloprovincialis TaxID=29158 RepID=A0A8B6H9Y7_MYTGA|nr:Hypothetical predicted protein [Mytilus galloprovincialis]